MMGKLTGIAFAVLLCACLTVPCLCAKDEKSSASAIQKLVEDGDDAEGMQSLLNWAGAV
jgi:hypothetical protein